MSEWRRRMMAFVTAAIFLVLPHLVGAAVERTWTGSVNTDWFNGGNWTGGDGLYPQAGDSVIIPSGKTVLLTNETAELTAFSITNSTMTFSNWTTRLRATMINIYSDGHLTHAPMNTNAVPGVTNRVYISGSNITVHAGGVIDVTAQGHRGGIEDGEAGQGPGGGGVLVSAANRFAGGGGYGGVGGFGSYASTGARGQEYGQPAAPLEPGSGAGRGSAVRDNHGGGLVVIEADGAVTVSGQILADGGIGNVNYAGGGSGGGIQIHCRTIEGNGTLKAAGGAGLDNVNYGGGGGGGRISVAFDHAAQQAVSPKPRLCFDVSRGPKPVNSSVAVQGIPGTVWMTSPAPFADVMNVQGFLYFASPFTWEIPELVVSNGQAVVITELSVDVMGDVLITGGGGLSISNDFGWTGSFNVGNHLVISNGFLRYQYIFDDPHSFSIGNQLTLTNNANLYLHAGMTNGGPQNYGGLLNLEMRDLTIPANCGLYVYSHPEDGGSIRVIANNVNVLSGGRIDSSGGGYRGGLVAGDVGLGLGGGFTHTAQGFSGGGGYGGSGGKGHGSGGFGGAANGQAEAPLIPGSGSGGVTGGAGAAGGGLIWLVVDQDVRVDGILVADGMNSPRIYAGGGSGGGIQVSCQTLRGNGTLQAKGGTPYSDLYGGAGGGGRIAVVFDPDAQSWVAPVPSLVFNASQGASDPGWSSAGQNGTIHLTNPLLVEPLFSVSGRLFFGTNVWSPSSLTISNAVASFDQEMSVHVAGDLNIINSGSLTLLNQPGWNASLSVGGNVTLDNGTLRYYYPQTNPHAFSVIGNLVMTNTSRLHLHAGPTNSTEVSYGGLLDLSGRDLVVSSGSILYPYVDSTNGGAMRIRARNLTVAEGGQVNADGGGFAGVTASAGRGAGGGPGGANYGGGGGYGGQGGISYNTGGGLTNGVASLPLYPGSAGGGVNGGPGGSGGGLVWLEIDNALTVNGMISANGGNNIGSYSGGGSGGGIVIQCASFAAGGSAQIRAIGGNSNHVTLAGRGGGGRIAVLRVNRAYFERMQSGSIKDAVVEPPPEEWLDLFAVTTGTGSGNPGGTGTVCFVTPKPIYGSVMMFR